ncbi:retropepsin-like aspartic protease [Cyanobium sp. NIES-981]|uniref:retropepsin-like aspartic protease n=1 Tax=Cyanobium sp. NIES-981 TaxID=1851505 RepID=UPI0007DD8448|nr:retropepsin-like aspartic protease [Cyanobium sp. NIES-981]SBO42727.1 conserved protein of unknown function [Cyanobium sp. NIES-981]
MAGNPLRQDGGPVPGCDVLGLTALPVAALIQLRGPALQPGVFSGAGILPLERALGGDTPVLSFHTLGQGQGQGGSAGMPVRLLLDTGASSSLVSPALVERLGLASTAIPPAAFGLAGAGVGCGSLMPRRSRLPPLRLDSPGGGHPSALPTLRGADVLVLPVGGLPADVDGVLGAPQLRQLPFWVDPQGGRLAFGPAALQLAAAASGRGEAQPTTHTLRWQRGVPLMALPLRQVPGQGPGQAPGQGSVPALADTGAEGLFMTPRLTATLPAVGESRPLRVAGFCGEQPASWTLLLGPHLIPPERSGGHPPAVVEAITTTNPVFETLGVEAIVGQSLLRFHRQLWRLDATPPSLSLWPLLPPQRRAAAVLQPIGISTRAKPRASTIWRIGTPNTVETRSIARVLSTAVECTSVKRC